MSTLLAVILAAPSSPAQVKPGQSIHTVAVSGATGEMYIVDHQTQKATKLTIPSIFATDICNTVLMTTSVTGYIGTTIATGTGNIYSFTLLNNTVSLQNNGKPLNTGATGGNNVAQLAILNKRIYFCTQDAKKLNTAGQQQSGLLQSIPLAGGAVQVDLDISTLQVPTTNLANALAVVGTVVYVATWDLSTTTTTGGDLVAYDTVGKKGTLVMGLPRSKYTPSTTTYGMGCVCMHPDQNTAGQLVLAGVYGDLVTINPDQKNGYKNPTVVSHQFTGNATGSVYNYTNSFFYDPTTKDWIVGTRDGHVDRWVDGHSAEKVIAGVGSNATPTANSVNGSHYFPVTTNHDHTIGAGCPGNGYVPTDVALGAALSPNPNFKFALFTGNGGAKYLLALGLQNKVSGSLTLPWQLPGTTCFLRMDPLVILASGTLAGTGAGVGTAVVPVAIPSGIPSGFTLYRQWAMDMGASGFVLSNAREIKFP